MKVINPVTLGVTEGAYSRASVAWYFNSQKKYVQAAINEMRSKAFDVATGEPVAAVIEGASKNMLLQSNGIGVFSPWSVSVSTYAAISGAGLDGGPATLITRNATGATGNWAETAQAIFVGAGGNSGNTYTASIYLWAAGNSPVSCGLTISDVNYNSTYSGAFTIDNVPRKYSFTSSGPVGGWSVNGSQIGFGLGIYTLGASIYAWGAQLEMGSVASSLIPTTTIAVARAADLFSGSAPCLCYCDAPEVASAWGPDVVYGLGALTRKDDNHRIYQSLITANKGIDPSISPAGSWLDVAPAARWAALDRKVGTVMGSGGATTLTISVMPGAINALAMLDISAADINIVMSDLAGNPIWSRYVDMAGGPPLVSYYDYFFKTPVRRTALIISDIPPINSSVITITLYDPSGPSVGTIGYGMAVDVGLTTYGVQVGIIDYSRKDTDAFGNTIVTKRAYSKRINCKLEIDATLSDEVARYLSSIRSTPVIWAGTDVYDSTIVYGYYKDFGIDVPYPTMHNCSLTIEGLT